MAKSSNPKRKKAPKTVLKLPDLEQSKSAVLNSLVSASSQRSYGKQSPAPWRDLQPGKGIPDQSERGCLQHGRAASPGGLRGRYQRGRAEGPQPSFIQPAHQIRRISAFGAAV